MRRVQEKQLATDLDKKIVILCGPRQVGKTTLAQNLGKKWKNHSYLNYDLLADKRIFLDKSWDRRKDLIIFDEIHKHKKWKNHIKGVFDKEGVRPRIMITGSARLDFQRKSGDSLVGRYFRHRLYPLTISELKGIEKPEAALAKLMKLGGFPEPYLSGSERSAARWRTNYLDRVIREEVRDITDIRDINSLTLLIDLLRERVGSCVSAASLSRDLQVSPRTIQNWLNILEGLYIIFRLTPWHKNIARSLLKEPKIYFYDTGLVRGDKGAVFENLCALSLLKHLHYLEDSEGIEASLHYIRDKEKREIDLAVVKNGKLSELIEIKYSEGNISKSLFYFKKRNPDTRAMQVCCSAADSRQMNGVYLEPGTAFLSKLKI